MTKGDTCEIMYNQTLFKILKSNVLKRVYNWNGEFSLRIFLEPTHELRKSISAKLIVNNLLAVF